MKNRVQVEIEIIRPKNRSVLSASIDPMTATTPGRNNYCYKNRNGAGEKNIRHEQSHLREPSDFGFLAVAL